MPAVADPPPGAAIRLRNARPAIAWLGLAVATPALGLLTLSVLREGPPPPTLAEGLVMAVFWLLLGLGWRGGLATPCTVFTLAPDGAAHLVSRFPTGRRREEAVTPAAVAGLDLHRTHVGPLRGWQIVLRLRDGRQPVLSEHRDGARQAAIAAEIRRRLGLAP